MFKDQITINDEKGNEKEFEVDAMFDMGGHSYALITSKDSTIVMRIEEDNGKQSLISATEEEMENIIDAYNLALDADLDEYKPKH